MASVYVEGVYACFLLGGLDPIIPPPEMLNMVEAGGGEEDEEEEEDAQVRLLKHLPIIFTKSVNCFCRLYTIRIYMIVLSRPLNLTLA